MTHALAVAALSGCATHPAATRGLGGSLFGPQKCEGAIAPMSTVIAAKQDAAYFTVADSQAFLKLSPKAPEAPAITEIPAGVKK
jgi:hypothetical protein